MSTFNDTNDRAAEAKSIQEQKSPLANEAVELLNSAAIAVMKQTAVSGMELTNLSIDDETESPQSNVSIDFIPPKSRVAPGDEFPPLRIAPPEQGRPHIPGGGMGAGGGFRPTPRLEQQPEQQRRPLVPGGGEVAPNITPNNAYEFNQSGPNSTPKSEAPSEQQKKALSPGGDESGPSIKPQPETALEQQEEVPPAQEEIPHPPENTVHTTELLKTGERFGKDLLKVYNDDGTVSPQSIPREEQVKGLHEVAEKFGKLMDAGESPATAIKELNDSLQKEQSPYRFYFLGPKEGPPSGLMLVSNNRPVVAARIPGKSKGN